MTAIKERQRAQLYIYKKQNNCETFYTQKARQFPLRFYIQKARHFTLHNFSCEF